MNLDQTNRYRDLLDQLLRSRHTFPKHRFEGRGIVLGGGGSYYFPCIGDFSY